MFRIDRTTNSITKLKPVGFSELGFSERVHLQEWLANQPDALGEELLVIQKEFAGFDDTKERLDLLALDKAGALVIIENKLDDSGRDVVWQGLKYSSYCSTLSKTNITKIYQEYLDRTGDGGDAKGKICEFLGEEDFEEISLNVGNEQRLIMVAAQFRKEVTSTVLWLLNHGIRIQCFKATPYQHGDLLFLNLEQVIPVPEAEELMIGISEKEKEENKVERGQVRRHVLRTEFWHKTLTALRDKGVTLYGNVSPGKDSWLYAGSGLGNVHYNMVFNQKEVRAEFVIGRRAKDENKAMFDSLYQRKAEIEQRFGAQLEWERLDDYKISAILCRHDFEGYNKENWPDMIDWLVEHIQKMEQTFRPEIEGLRRLLRSDEPEPEGGNGEETPLTSRQGSRSVS